MASAAEFLYGRRAVLESLRAGRRSVRRVLLAEGLNPHTDVIGEIVAAARARSCPVVVLPRSGFPVAGDVNHQGVAIEASPYPYIDANEVLAERPTSAPLYLVLDHLQDVQNVGTLLRTAEAMAVTAAFLPDRRAAAITPAVVNASAGAVEHLRVCRVVNLARTLEQLKDAGVWVVGLEADPQAVALGKADLTGPLALVVGAEGSGLARLTRERCDWLLTIPMYGRVASLNAAVAGSIALVAARQARGRA